MTTGRIAKHPGKTLLELVMPNSRWEDQTPDTQDRWLRIAIRVIQCDRAGDFRNDWSIGEMCRVLEEQHQRIEELERRGATPKMVFIDHGDAVLIVTRRAEVAEARVAELEAQAAARAGVVVPEPEVSTLASLAAYSNPVDAVRATLQWARKNARALPASRVLGEMGMVGLGLLGGRKRDAHRSHRIVPEPQARNSTLVENRIP